MPALEATRTALAHLEGRLGPTSCLPNGCLTLAMKNSDTGPRKRFGYVQGTARPKCSENLPPKATKYYCKGFVGLNSNITLAIAANDSTTAGAIYDKL